MTDDINLERDLACRAEDIGVALDGDRARRLVGFARRLDEKNRTINLVGARDLQAIIEDHVLDSLALVPLVAEAIEAATCVPATIIDVGSGGGLPALVLAIVFEQTQVACIESVGKKARALAELSEQLGLRNVAVINERAELAARESAWREKAGVATARAVGRLATVCELALPFVAVGGRLLAQKGSRPDVEISEARWAIAQLGGRLHSVVRVGPPRPEGRRTVVIVEKIEPTPDRFPRRPGLPAKRPLREKVK